MRAPPPPPPGKKWPPRPGQGQRSARHRRWHRRVARGPPPTTPLGGWSPQVPTTARRRKHGPERPLGAPTKSHSLIRKRPLEGGSVAAGARSVRLRRQCELFCVGAGQLFISFSFLFCLGDYYVQAGSARSPHSGRSAPELAQRTGGNFLLCVSPCRRAKWGSRSPPTTPRAYLCSVEGPSVSAGSQFAVGVWLQHRRCELILSCWPAAGASAAATVPNQHLGASYAVVLPLRLRVVLASSRGLSHRRCTPPASWRLDRRCFVSLPCLVLSRVYSRIISCICVRLSNINSSTPKARF
jgi:hypothetical protein